MTPGPFDDWLMVKEWAAVRSSSYEAFLSFV
jgi:hypothetical protein